MADEIDLSNPNGADEPLPQVAILTQYVKDLSFENPNAPASLQSQEQPRIDVNVAVNAKRAADNVFEVELKINARAMAGDSLAFVVDVLYVGLFGLRSAAALPAHRSAAHHLPVRPPHRCRFGPRRRLPAADARPHRLRLALHGPAAERPGWQCLT
jgi:protein-export chaperone SecB